MKLVARGLEKVITLSCRYLTRLVSAFRGCILFALIRIRDALKLFGRLLVRATILIVSTLFIVWALFSLQYNERPEVGNGLIPCLLEEAHFLCDRLSSDGILLQRQSSPALFAILPELIGGIVIYVVASAFLYRYRVLRRQALRNTVYQNAMPMLLLLERLKDHFIDEPLPTDATKQQNHFVAFIRTFLWASQRAERSISLNDMLSADAILKLDRDEFEAVHANTRAIYELTSNFEFLKERLSSRDLFKLGYHHLEIDQLRSVYQSVVSDITESGLKDDLETYKTTAFELFRTLRGKRGTIKAINRDIAALLLEEPHDQKRVPTMPKFSRRLSGRLPAARSHAA